MCKPYGFFKLIGRSICLFSVCGSVMAESGTILELKTFWQPRAGSNHTLVDTVFSDQPSSTVTITDPLTTAALPALQMANVRVQATGSPQTVSVTQGGGSVAIDHIRNILWQVNPGLAVFSLGDYSTVIISTTPQSALAATAYTHNKAVQVQKETLPIWDFDGNYLGMLENAATTLKVLD